MRAAGQTCLPIMQTGCAGVFQKDMCSCGIPSVPDRSPGWPSRRRLWTASFSGRRIRSSGAASGGIPPLSLLFSVDPHALRRTRRAGPAGQGTPRLRFPGAGGTHRPDRLVWRYDPVLLSPEWTAARHIEAFGALCRALAGSTDTCIVSFLDRYRHCEPAFRRLCIRPPDEAERAQLLAAFRRSAASRGLTLRACCEEESGLPPASCIDAERLARLGGFSLPVHQDRSQRRGCTCAEAVDIGAYGTCPAGCAYCYATDPSRPVCRFSQESPVAGAPLTGADHIRDRAMPKRRRPVSPSLFPEL